MCINRENKCSLKDDLRYLKLLSKQYPTIAEASTEIINLQAILNLPKSTEHFLTDIHGEYESFNHVLKNASGVIKRKIRDALGDTISPDEAKSLATLIYYPEQKLDIVRGEGQDTYRWYEMTIERLIKICKHVSSKYTRHKVRKALPTDFSYIIEELLHERPDIVDKERYYSEIINTIIRIDRGDEFISAVSKVIQRLVIDRLHIIGDIFDRGPGADIVMDTIMEHHSVDIQWGNHDILWMGAAAGSDVCIATVLRICARYMNLDTVEDGYGINTLPLATFALETYGSDSCASFRPKVSKDNDYSVKYRELITKMHKAISIIQFKLEGEVIRRNAYMDMEDRLLLDKIDYSSGRIELEGIRYDLNDRNFPTIDPEDPYRLSEEEEDIVRRLRMSFENSDRLQSHIRFLFAKGSMYLKCNSNLLYHGCIPVELDSKGDISFKQVSLDDTEAVYSGKDYLDKLDLLVREGYFYGESPERRQYGKDLMWYLWTGKNSPLFGKDRMTTFERYFVDDKESHLEVKNDYFKLQDSEEMCNMIFKEFGLDSKSSHIINGHVPVKFKKGESPIKANGKLLVIDGGFSRAYQPTTGIAGYTLIYNSYGLLLASHEPFESTERAIEEEKDILSTTVVLEREVERKRVGDTDIGEELRMQIDDLERLLEAYRKGFIKERK